MSNVISWSADPNSTTIISFKAYKSICGTYSSAPPFSVIGKYLKIQTDANDFPRTIKLNSDVVADIVAQINSIPGAFSKIESSGIISIRSAGKFLKIFETDGASSLGFAASDYVPQKTWALANSQPFVTGEATYSFTDVDGYPGDWYHITTIDSVSVESLPSLAIQQDDNYLNVCSLEGLVVDFAGGKPFKNARVFAKLFEGLTNELF